MIRILKSLLTIVAVGAIATSATSAYFSDTETSTGNTFAAGTLDLNVDGGNTNVVKFNVSNLKPGSQPSGAYTLANVGSINGYLDLENISIVSAENGILDMEADAGDVTADKGELEDVLNVRLFVDRDGDGWIGAGDTVFYNGKVKDLPTSFDLNEPINAGSSTKVRALFDWWSSANDNLAQGDGFTLDMAFELAQTTGQ